MAGGRPSGRWRSFLRGLLTQLAILLVTLAAIEVMLRVADLRFLRDGARPGYALVYRYDPDLGWAPVPNARAEFTGSRTVSVHNNSIGMRDIEHGRGGRPRILFIGDSFTWGFDVEAKDRFTEILRRRLPQADVFNAGVPGYGTDQEYLLLEKLWDAVRPDVVVLMFCSDNDRDDNSSNMRYDGYYKPYVVQADGGWQFRGRPVPKSRRVYFVDNWLVRNSWLARAAVSAWVQVAVPRIYVPDPTERLIMMMHAYVEARGARLLVGVQQNEWHDPQLDLFLTVQKIPYVSLDGADIYDDFGYHWTPTGQAFVADALLTLFGRNGIVDAKPAQQDEDR